MNSSILIYESKPITFLLEIKTGSFLSPKALEELLKGILSLKGKARGYSVQKFLPQVQNMAPEYEKNYGDFHLAGIRKLNRNSVSFLVATPGLFNIK